MISEDFHKVRPNTPLGSYETTSYDYDYHYNNSSAGVKMVPIDKSKSFNENNQNQIDEYYNEHNEDTHEINLSHNSSEEEHETIERNKISGSYLSFVNKSKHSNFQTDRTAKSSGRNKVRKDIGQTATKDWQKRLHKDLSMMKPVVIKKNSLSTVDNSTTTKKSRKEYNPFPKGNVTPIYQKNSDERETQAVFKTDDRLNEFKLLKESFLRSVFTKAKDDIVKPISKSSHVRHFTNMSFDDKNYRNAMESATLKLPTAR
jgi:hypothetical protein